MKLNFHDKINAGITNNFLSFSPSFVKLRNLLAQFVAAYIESIKFFLHKREESGGRSISHFDRNNQ